MALVVSRSGTSKLQSRRFPQLSPWPAGAPALEPTSNSHRIVRGREISALRSRQTGFLHFPRRSAQSRQGARRHRHGYADLAHYDALLSHQLWLRRYLDVSALRPPELPEFLRKRRDPGLRFMVALGEVHQDTYPPHSLRLLSACRKRATRPPRCR